MKILTTLHSVDHLDNILSVADGILIGDARFSKTLTTDFKDKIDWIVKKTVEKKKEVYILLNRIYTDRELDEVKAFVLSLDHQSITGFIGADIGLVYLFKSIGLVDKLVYNPETLLTNDVDFNDLAPHGIKGAFVSKEITLEDILEIGRLKKYPLYYFGHGHMSMFYSKRQMLDTFSTYQNKENVLHHDKSLRLSEAKRREEVYPIFEDDAGTHVFRGKVFNSFKAINALKEVVDYMVVDTLFLDDLYAVNVIPMYQNGLDETLKEKLLSRYKEDWHDGFLFDESTIKGDIK